MSEMWRFLLGKNPCDICTPMANHYPYRPHVPVHRKCDCTVEKIPSNENCTTELRNVESTEVKYSDTQLHTADLYNDSPNDVQASIPVKMGTLTEAWEDPRLPGKLGWNPPSGTQPASFILPSESAGEIRVMVEYEVTQVVAKAELWEVCRRRPALGETMGHTTSERKLRIVGGGAAAITAILGAEIQNIVETDDMYRPDDEVPA